MSCLWERLDADYKIYLQNICTPDEFQASSLIERGQLRKQFLDHAQSSQEISVKTETNFTDDNNNKDNKNNTKIKEVVHESDNLAIDLCGSDDNEDIDSNIKHSKKIKEENKINNTTTASTAVVVTPSLSPNKRKCSSVVKCKQEEEDGGSQGDNAGSNKMAALSSSSCDGDDDKQSDGNGQQKQEPQPRKTWCWLLAPDGSPSMGGATAIPAARSLAVENSSTPTTTRRSTGRIVRPTTKAATRGKYAKSDDGDSDYEDSSEFGDEHPNSPENPAVPDKSRSMGGTTERRVEPKSNRTQRSSARIRGLTETTQDDSSTGEHQSNQTKRSSTRMIQPKIETKKDNDSTEDQPPNSPRADPAPLSSSSTTLPTKVKKEEEFKAAIKDALEKFGDLDLIHRFLGIGLLGGGIQNTFQCPCEGSSKVWINGELRSGYPLHERALVIINGTPKYDMDAFIIVAMNGSWQSNAPQFACQPTAAVNCLPDCMKEKGLALPFFIKRSLTKRTNKRENKVLGWEYVGNYRCITDPDLCAWESAKNFTEASKHEMARKYLKSAQSQSNDTYGSHALGWWRDHLMDLLTEKEQNDNNNDNGQTAAAANNATQSSMISRALALGFKRDISDKDLSHLVVELDEFHHQEIIEFAYYDERIYNFCSKGPTSKNSKGSCLAKEGGTIAKARDWYNFANEHMI